MGYCDFPFGILELTDFFIAFLKAIYGGRTELD